MSAWKYLLEPSASTSARTFFEPKPTVHLQLLRADNFDNYSIHSNTLFDFFNYVSITTSDIKVIKN